MPVFPSWSRGGCTGWEYETLATELSVGPATGVEHYTGAVFHPASQPGWLDTYQPASINLTIRCDTGVTSSTAGAIGLISSTNVILVTLPVDFSDGANHSVTLDTSSVTDWGQVLGVFADSGDTANTEANNHKFTLVTSSISMGAPPTAEGFSSTAFGVPESPRFTQGFSSTQFGAPRLNAEQATGFQTTHFGSHYRVFDQTCLAVWVDTSGTDPDWEYRTLALHCDGPDGGTVIADETGKIPSARTLVTTSTTNCAPLDGNTASLYFNGQVNPAPHVTFPADTAHNSFGTGDFIIDGWFYASADAPSDQIIFRTSDAAWTLFLTNYGERLIFQHPDSSLGIVSLGSLPLETWYHFEVNRIAGVARLFIDGALQNTTAFATDLSDPAAPLRIGSYDSAFTSLKGYLDDLRISKGIGGHTENFTRPTTSFLNGTVAGQNEFGLPRAANFNIAPSLGRVTAFGLATTPTVQTVYPEGFQATRFGDWTYTEEEGGPLPKAGRAVGFRTTAAGTPTMTGAVTCVASGTQDTWFGLPISGRSHAAASSQATAFGLPSASFLARATGVKATAFGTPRSGRGFIATPAYRPTRFGLPTAERSATYKPYAINSTARFGQPQARQGALQRVTGFPVTSFGQPDSAFLYRAMHLSPSTRIGTPLLKRTPLC